MRIATKDKPASFVHTAAATAGGYSAMVVKGKRAVKERAF